MMTQVWLKLNSGELITIVMPIARTMRPAGANSFSPTNAARRASVAISSGSSLVSAQSAKTVSVIPPPTQKTATLTWIHLKAANQCVMSSEVFSTKTRPTATTAARIPRVIRREGAAAVRGGAGMGGVFMGVGESEAAGG